MAAFPPSTSSTSTMAPTPTAIRRLQRDLQNLEKEPIDGIRAVPLEENILEWHYVIEGTKGTPYEGGYYHGRLLFQPDFPWKPPSIYMDTPSGRFQPNVKLCLSISDYHPETWNPGWTVSAILVGLHSFMNDTQFSTGCENTTLEKKKELAESSKAFNLASPVFQKVFPDLCTLFTSQGVVAMSEEESKAATTRRRGHAVAEMRVAVENLRRLRHPAGGRDAAAPPDDLRDMINFPAFFPPDLFFVGNDQIQMLRQVVQPEAPQPVDPIGPALVPNAFAAQAPPLHAPPYQVPLNPIIAHAPARPPADAFLQRARPNQQQTRYAPPPIVNRAPPPAAEAPPPNRKRPANNGDPANSKKSVEVIDLT